MDIKNEDLYPNYIAYIESTTSSKGTLSLLKMSKTKFEVFKKRYEKDEDFRISQDQLYKSFSRDNKINDVLSNPIGDFDDFLNDIETQPSSSITDFDDFFNLL